MNYRFSTLINGIYLLEFESRYDLAMHFLRAQEYYESPNEDFKGKNFDIWDYLEWYSKEHGDRFTYPSDWCGFNIPGRILRALYNKPHLLKGKNKYDNFMAGLLEFITLQIDKREFYLIGSITNDSDTIDHELAHGLWQLNDSYRQEQKENISKLGEERIEQMNARLDAMGYTKEVFDDEIQAYLSTGLVDAIRESAKLTTKTLSPFVKTYKKYTKGIK